MITGRQIIEVKVSIKKIFDDIIDFVKNIESFDMMLEKLKDNPEGSD